MSATIRPVRPTPVFRNGFATAALALGIVGVGLGLGLTALVGLATIVVGSLAVALGALGLLRAFRYNAGDATMAVLGTLAGLVAVALAVSTYLS